MKRKTLQNLILSGFWLALCILLPFLTGQIPQIGTALSPMHIPVLLCGFVCGAPWGALVGLVAPPLRFLLFGMPPIFPTGVAMMFELAAYGALAGLLYRRLPKRLPSVYASLLGAMLGGRIVWGLASWVLMRAVGGVYTWQLFFAGAFINALPGIVLHILLIPPIVIIFQKIGVLPGGKEKHNQ